MENKHIHFPWAIALVIAGAFIAYLILNPHGGENHYHTTTILKYDSAQRDIPVPLPIPIQIINSQAPQNLDTAAIMDLLRHYFEKKIYEQTFSDSNFSATVRDTIQKNSIVGRGFSYKITRPTTIITNTTIEDRGRRLYLGGRAGAGLHGLSAGPAIYYVNKKDNLFTFDYDAVKKSYNFGGAILLFKKK